MTSKPLRGTQAPSPGSVERQPSALACSSAGGAAGRLLRRRARGGTPWGASGDQATVPLQGPRALWIPGAPRDGSQPRRLEGSSVRTPGRVRVQAAVDRAEPVGQSGGLVRVGRGRRAPGSGPAARGALPPCPKQGSRGRASGSCCLVAARSSFTRPPGDATEPPPPTPGPHSSPGRVSLHREGPLNVDGVPLVFKHAVAQGHLCGRGSVRPAGPQCPQLCPRLALRLGPGKEPPPRTTTRG